MSSMSGTLGELASDAGMERTAFLASAGDQLKRFLDANKDRIKEIGGLVLIDEDPDYLSVAPDGTFRSRTRYQDEVTGEWHSETEIIESAAELVELYNPADVLAAFAESAREQAGLPEEPTATEDLMEAAGVAPDETDGGVGEDDYADDGYAQAADDWARGQAAEAPPATPEDAARRMYDLALTFQERSQHSEARLIEQFETIVQDLAPVVGDMMVLDDEDERLWLKRSGRFEAEVVPESEEDDRESRDGNWRRLETPDTLVEFYDPTDVFGDLAEALADSFPSVSEDDDTDDDDFEDDETDDEDD
jgi:hypothetical protein